VTAIYHVISCDLGIFVDQATKPVTPQDADSPDVEAVADVGRGDREDHGRRRRLVVVSGGVVPDLVGYWAPQALNVP